MDQENQNFRREVGRFDHRTHPMEFELGPFGRMEIGSGMENIALIDCNAIAVQIVNDGTGVRLPIGGCVPSNGVQRFIRNPYSFSIKGQILLNMPLTLTPAQDPLGTEFGFVHRVNAAKQGPTVAGKKSGVVVMPKRGGYMLNAYGNTFMRVSILPKAKVEYLSLMPPAINSVELKAYRSDGSEDQNLVLRHIEYVDADVVAWLELTDWKVAPVMISEDYQNAVTYIDENTAAIVFYDVTRAFEFSGRFADLGYWNASWQV